MPWDTITLQLFDKVKGKRFDVYGFPIWHNTHVQGVTPFWVKGHRSKNVIYPQHVEVFYCAVILRKRSKHTSTALKLSQTRVEDNGTKSKTANIGTNINIVIQSLNQASKFLDLEITELCVYFAVKFNQTLNLPTLIQIRNCFALDDVLVWKVTISVSWQKFLL